MTGQMHKVARRGAAASELSHLCRGRANGRQRGGRGKAAPNKCVEEIIVGGRRISQRHRVQRTARSLGGNAPKMAIRVWLSTQHKFTECHHNRILFLLLPTPCREGSTIPRACPSILDDNLTHSCCRRGRASRNGDDNVLGGEMAIRNGCKWAKDIFTFVPSNWWRRRCLPSPSARDYRLAFWL